MDTTVWSRATAMRACAPEERELETVVEMPRPLFASECNATWAGEVEVFEVPLMSKDPALLWGFR